MKALTKRELEVVTLMADGYSNQEIGDRLDISIHTIKFHADHVIKKLGGNTKAGAVGNAFRQGLIV